MRDLSDFFAGPPESWPDAIVFTSGEAGPPRWHVREQEALIAALPLCPLQAAGRDGHEAVPLTSWGATIWLPPNADAAELDEEEPDSDSAGPPPPMRVEGWSWPDEVSLTIMIGTDPDLPARHALERYGPDDYRVDLAVHPMRVRRYATEDTVERTTHWAVVDGFLDGRHTFYAGVSAATPERRDALVAALLTFTCETHR